jgi:hypothetical protein
MENKETNSFLILRRIIGACGFLLPVILLTFGLILNQNIEKSISDYYGTNMRDVFVGIMFTVGFFLFAYPGYDIIDKIFCKLGTVFAIGVALCAVTSNIDIIQTFHYIFAGCLFLDMSYISIFLFTKGSLTKGNDNTQKKKRNIIYITCGIIMLFFLIVIPIVKIISPEADREYKITFILETLILWAFGTSWAIKGRTLLKDKEK